MKHRWLIPTALLSLLACTVAAQPVARLAAVRGEVHTAPAGTEVFSVGRVGQTISPGDLVRTGEGMAELRFSDGSRTILGPRTDLRITEMAEERATGVRHMVLSLLAGMVRAVVTPLSPGSSFEISSSHAVTAVKGTDFVFDGSRVSVLDEYDGRLHRVEFQDLAARTTRVVVMGWTAAIGFGDDSRLRPLAAGEQESFRSFFPLDLMTASSFGSPPAVPAPAMLPALLEPTGSVDPARPLAVLPNPDTLTGGAVATLLSPALGASAGVAAPGGRGGLTGPLLGGLTPGGLLNGSLPTLP